MFVVYKITNLINNMCYIGSSVNVKRRWKQHINASKNISSPIYNYPLYQAFRQFELKNFSFEIINDDFDSIEEMENYEQQMIDKYNSLVPNGYNQTRQTHSNNIQFENYQKHIQKISQKCAKVNNKEEIIEIYLSYHDAARKNNKDGDYNATKVRQVCKGELISCFNGMYFRDLDNNNNIISKPIKNYKKRKTIIGINVNIPEQEIYFSSISECSKKIGADRQSISKCVNGNSRYSIVHGYIFREIDKDGNIVDNGISIEEKINEYNLSNPIINGVRHSISEWCQIYNISKNSYYYRLKKGMTPEEAITMPKKGG